MKASHLPKLLIQRLDNPRGRLDAAGLTGVVTEISLDRLPADEAAWEPFVAQAERAVLALRETSARRAATDLMGAVLAGGASTRMGTDKLALPLPGWPAGDAGLPVAGTWLEHAFLLVAERCDPSWVVGRLVEAGGGALPLLEAPVAAHLDLRGALGPVGGWETALTLARGRGVLALPGDLPFLRPEVLDGLLAHRERTAGATAFRRADGRAEPAVVILEPACGEWLRSFLDAGERKAEAFLERAGVRWVPLPAEFEPDFANLNTPEDRMKHRA